MGPNLEPSQLERQQALLVERLRAAGGAAVSFEELRAIGIENPALLCYELAAVGVPVTRTSVASEGMPAQSVRLELEHEPEAPRDEAPKAWGPALLAEALPRALAAKVLPRALSFASRQASATRTHALALLKKAAAPTRRPVARARASLARGRFRPPTLVSMFALAAVLAAIIAIALSDGTGGAPPGSPRAGGDVRAAPSTMRRGPPPSPRPAPAPAPTPAPRAGARPPTQAPALVSPVRAAALQAEGHQLLADGSYQRAIDRLLGAIRASGQSLARCVEPASETCLTFAYALYDLGRALRLQGDRAAAVTILSERLRINDQRSVVQRELDLARGASA